MTARTANAFTLSLLLHAAFAAAMLYTAYALKDEIIDKGRIMELVAGEGDNYAATEAPALGTPGGDVKFELPPGPVASPTPPAPAIPLPEPIAPAPEPVTPAPIEAPPPPPKPEPKHTPAPKPEPSPVVKADPKPTTKAEPVLPNPNRTFKRVTARIESKQKAQRDKEAKEAAKAAALAAKNAELAAKKAALEAQRKAGGGGSTKIAKIDAKGIAAGVLGGSTANTTGGAGGKALSREEQDELDSYKAMINQRLQKEHQKPEGLSENLVARAEFLLSSSGAISKAHIIETSGNSEFDKSVLNAINSIRTPPPPKGWSGSIYAKFRMKDDD